jgi:hypothetical protein
MTRQREKETAIPLFKNDCLHPGPPLQNHLWDVLVKSRTYPILAVYRRLEESLPANPNYRRRTGVFTIPLEASKHQ